MILYALFFFSGCAAIIYQVMWQRMLFVIFGVDLDSITIIVSVFMFGLGIGGLLGGYIADTFAHRLLFLYVLIELSIALFGFASSNIIDVLGNALMSNSKFVTALASFLILAFPTILMGSTFPILVTHVNQYDNNIGRSVGRLYHVNAFGGAIGAFLSGFVLLYILDLTESVQCAAFLNLIIAGIAFLLFRRQR